MDELEQKRNTLYQQSSTQTQDLYADSTLGGILGELIGEFSIPPEKQKAFIHVYGDAILAIHTVRQIDGKLSSEIGLTAEQVAMAREKLKSILNKIESGVTIPDASIESKERLQLRPDAKPANDPTRPLTREEVMNALGAKRTMAQDMEAARLKHEGGTTPSVGVPPRPH